MAIKIIHKFIPQALNLAGIDNFHWWFVLVTLTLTSLVMSDWHNGCHLGLTECHRKKQPADFQIFKNQLTRYRYIWSRASWLFTCVQIVTSCKMYVSNIWDMGLRRLCSYIYIYIYTLGKKGCYTPGWCVFFVIISISISSVREV